MVSKSGNADTVDDQLLVIGVTQNRMVFNVELYEKCAMAYTLARLSGEKIRRRLIAENRLKSDMKKAAERYAAGLEAEETKAC
ncbi:MAG: hypothetical protein P8X79_01200 [Reinekea sp.]